MMTRILGFGLRLTLVSIIAFTAMTGNSFPNRQSAAAQAMDNGFGPHLYLLGPAPQPEILSALPATLHAMLQGEGLPRYIASGDADLPERAADVALPVQLLDADTTGKVYYFVDAQVDGAPATASQFGAIIYADAQQLLVALPAANEPGLLETLPAQGVSLALLSPAAIVLEGITPRAPAMAEVESAAEPAIAALLPQVTAQALADQIAELSGERTADTGSGAVTLLTRYTFANAIQDTERYLYQRYVQFGLPVTYANWSYGGYSGRNVVAEIRGTLHPERIWLIGGHFDDTSETPYTRAPGADDNASGTAATLVIAGILRSHRFADTIRFVHFSAEEQGHWGSQAYVRSLTTAGAQVMGFINLDMIGWDGDGDRTLEIHSGTRANSVSLASRFTMANLRYDQGLQVEVKSASASRFSDHASFWDNGYPAFMAIENFFDDAILRDRNPWYHKTGDLLSRVNLDYAVRTTRASLAMLAEGAVIDPEPAPTSTPSRTPTPTSTPGTPTSTPTAAACAEAVANGGFESNSAWTFANTANPASYTTAQARTGTRSVRLGIVPGGYSAVVEPDVLDSVPADQEERNLLGEIAPLGASYSTAYQTIAIPASARAATLAFWYRPGTQATTGDFQRVMLLKPGTYGVLATVLKTLENAATWRRATFDLTPYRGQNVVLYFEVYNNDISAGARTWMYLDDVSGQACADAAVTPTGTPTPTASPMPTRTPTPTASPMPTRTPTPTVTPNAPTPTPTVTASVTPTLTPTAAACGERVANPGFEANSAWTFALTGNTGGYTTAQAHAGQRSARLGIAPSAYAAGESALMIPAELPPGPERNLLGELAAAGASYSTVYQTVSIPADAASATLTFWHKTGTQATSGDFQRVLLLRPTTYAVLQVLMKTLKNSESWLQAQFDLSGYRGQSVVIYFEVYNDNVSSSPRTWLFVDDVSMQSCRTGLAVSEP